MPYTVFVPSQQQQQQQYENYKLQLDVCEEIETNRTQHQANNNRDNNNSNNNNNIPSILHRFTRTISTGSNDLGGGGGGNNAIVNFFAGIVDFGKKGDILVEIMKEKSNVIGDVEVKDIKVLKKYLRYYIVLIIDASYIYIYIIIE